MSSLPSFLPGDPRVEEPYRVTPGMAVRIAILGAIAIAFFAVLFFRLWALQIISGDRYLEEARNNQVRVFRTQAQRGAIVDRDGELLVSNRAGTLVQIWPAALADLPTARRLSILRRLADLFDTSVKEINGALRRGKADPLTPVTIRESVHDEKVKYLLEHQAKFPGVQVTQTQLRRYEYGSLAAQVFGYVGEISPDQLAERAGRGYAAGDRIGQAGVEAAFDRYLRGVPGEGQVRVDALGRVTSSREFSRLPEPGYSVRLTLDLELQRAAEDALRYGIRLARAGGEWAADGGAIVAMEPRTGEILALASNPTFDPSVYVGRIEPKALRRLADPAANHPTLNRAIAGIYPPGSTFKPAIALAAMQERFLSPSEVIQCTGKIEIGADKQVFTNWDPYKNEPMQLATALANSCDTYFYQVALRAYRRPDSPIQRWARRLGFGHQSGIELGPEAEGLVPTPAWRRRTFTGVDRVWTSGDSVQLGIGQGDVLVTPIQMARFYSLLANGGKLVQPTIIKEVEQPATEGQEPVPVRTFPPPEPADVGLDPAAVAAVQRGLYEATHAPYGTSTSVFADFPELIAGKTGTAEKYVELPGYKGLRDQSWWCGWGPYGDPKLVVCALIENGGHGGEAAAPAALKVFESFFHIKPGSYSSGSVESD
ncbi:MAG: penicillin-binding protein 2 [Actinomycetota bacterium]|nr:penicillin-binding protein 2 [Actinomycetota bacterium]